MPPVTSLVPSPSKSRSLAKLNLSVSQTTLYRSPLVQSKTSNFSATAKATSEDSFCHILPGDHFKVREALSLSRVTAWLVLFTESLSLLLSNHVPQCPINPRPDSPEAP